MSHEEAVIHQLRSKQHIMSSVESCTGGLIAHRITNVSGSSEVFWGGHVVYDNSAKIALGVDPNEIEKFGAVSQEVSRSLALAGIQAILSNSHAAQSVSLLKRQGIVCVSTTGIAGPKGGTPSKPVGLCYISVAISGKEPITEAFQSQANDRLTIKTEFAERALEMIRSSL